MKVAENLFIRFFLEKREKTKDCKMPIYIELSVTGSKEKEFSTGMKTHLELWDQDILLNNLYAAGRTMGINEKYESFIAKTFENQLTLKKENRPEHFIGMTDDHLSKMAKVVFDAYVLPSERLINIINEMKTMLFFYTYADIDNYELLFDLRHLQDPQTRYASRSKFVIVSKKSGIESSPDTIIERLTEEFGALKK